MTAVPPHLPNKLTYNGPEQPVWTARPDWLREVNARFQKGEILG